MFANFKTSILIGLLCAALAVSSYAEAKKSEAQVQGKEGKLDIYLLIGGRNMCGRGRFTRDEVYVNPKNFLLNRKDEWEFGVTPMNRYSSIVRQLDLQKLGLAPGFLKAMGVDDPEAVIGLVSNAKEKSSIKEWAKGSEYYKEAVRRVRIAQKTGVLRGILWHQGEPDRKNLNYLEELKTLIGDFRAEFKNPELPFIAGQILKEKRFNDELLKLPNELAFTGVVSSEGLKRDDSRAFDTISLGVLGQRYAETFLKVRGQRKGAPSAAPQVPTPITYEGKKEDLHIYLLIGQSNMAGRAPYTIDDVHVIEGVWLLNLENKWEEASVPLNRHATIITRMDTNGLNPGYGFSKVLRKANPKVSIGLISNARGSTSIRAWGQTTRYFKAALKRVKIAQETGVFKGILWHQGESDESDTKYLEKLKAMVEAWRSELNMPNLPFLAGQITHAKKGDLINSQINQLPGVLPFTAVVPSKGLPMKDVWHFNNEGMKGFGLRYGEEMLKLHAKQ